MQNQDRHWFDFPSIVLLIILLFLASYCLEDAGWVPNLNRVTVLTLFGGMIGSLLGQSRFNPKTSFWMGLILSFEILSWQLIFIGNQHVLWSEKFILFIERIKNAINQLMSNQPLTDGILFFIGMAILYWFLGLISGFQLTRNGKPWLTLIIAGIVIFTIQLFQPVYLRNNLLSAVFCFLFFLLITRMKYLTEHHNWEKNNFPEDQNIFPTIRNFAIIVIFILTFVSWNAPLIIRIASTGSKEQLEFREKFNNIWLTGKNFFAPLHQKVSLQSGNLGNTLSLTAGRSTRMDLLFSIKTTSLNSSGNQYYWRGRYFENYQNGIWTNGDYSEEKKSANDEIESTVIEQTDMIDFEFTTLSNQFIIYFQQIPVSINRNVVLLKLKTQGESDLISILPEDVIEKDESYIVKSAIRNLYLSDLLSAVEEYPQWIKNKNLQLPARDMSKVYELTLNITNGKNTIFEKVKAVTQYLRTNYSYTDSITDLPLENIDIIEWFLFSKKSGFCTYYASAEVLMLRSIGIPARLAVGYSQGTTTGGGKIFEVRDKDNHAWPEIYFNNVGWVPFEPTPSQPDIEYVTAKETLSTSNQTENTDLLSPDQLTGGVLRPNRWERGNDEETANDSIENINLSKKPGYYRYLIIIILFILIIIWSSRKFIFRKNSLPAMLEKRINSFGLVAPGWLTGWDGWIRKTKIEKIFMQMDLMLIFLGEKLYPALSARMKVGRFLELIPESGKDALQLLNEFEKEKFAGKKSNIVLAQQAIKKLWIDVLMKIIKSARNKFLSFFRVFKK
jgi:hypothetical protein